MWRSIRIVSMIVIAYIVSSFGTSSSNAGNDKRCASYGSDQDDVKLQSIRILFHLVISYIAGSFRMILKRRSLVIASYRIIPSSKENYLYCGCNCETFCIIYVLHFFFYPKKNVEWQRALRISRKKIRISMMDYLFQLWISSEISHWKAFWCSLEKASFILEILYNQNFIKFFGLFLPLSSSQDVGYNNSN